MAQLLWVQNYIRQGDDLAAIPAGTTLPAAKRMALRLARETQWPHVVITLLTTGKTAVLWETPRLSKA